MFVVNVRINKKIFIKVFTIITIILILILFILTIKKVIIPASKNNMLKINVNTNSIKNDSNNYNKNDLKNSNEADNKINNKESSNTNKYKSKNNKDNNDNNDNNNNNNEILEINTNNFTTFLKKCNEDIASYVGRTVHISGFVYRLSDFTKNQFVISRLMPIHYQNVSTKKSNYMAELDYNNKLDLKLYKETDIKFSKQLLAEQDSNDNCVVVGILCEGNNLSDFKSNSWVDITGVIKAGNYKGRIPIINVSSIKQIESNPNELIVEQPQ